MQKSVRSFQIVSPQNRPKKKSQDKSTMQSRFLAKKKMINWRLPQSLFSRNKLTDLKGWFPITSQLLQTLLFLRMTWTAQKVGNSHQQSIVLEFDLD